jgi:hypothetical protein
VQHSNLSEHIHPVLVGQRQVQDDYVKGALSDLRHAVVSASGNLDGVALELQKSFERLADLRFVVDDQDPARAFRLGASRSAAARDRCDFRNC